MRPHSLTLLLVKGGSEGKEAHAGTTATAHTGYEYPTSETICAAVDACQANLMIHLTEPTLFSGASLPLKIHSMAVETPTGRIMADCVKIVFVTEGWSHLRFDGGQSLLTPGSIVVIPAGVWCSATPGQFVRTVTIYVQSDFLSGQLQWLPQTHPLLHHLRKVSKGERTPKIVDIGQHNVAALRPSLSMLVSLSGYAPGGLMILARLADLFQDLELMGGQLSPSDLQYRPSIPHPRVRAAVHAMNARLEHVWTIRELSQTVAMSESQLARLFRRDLGTSPAVYLSHARADRMAELLISERTSVGEAARAVGWSDPSVASRAFKRRYGISPSQFIMTPNNYTPF